MNDAATSIPQSVKEVGPTCKIPPHITDILKDIRALEAGQPTERVFREKDPAVLLTTIKAQLLARVEAPQGAIYAALSQDTFTWYVMEPVQEA